jgi:hypothetical protein
MTRPRPINDWILKRNEHSGKFKILENWHRGTGFVDFYNWFLHRRTGPLDLHTIAGSATNGNVNAECKILSANKYLVGLYAAKTFSNWVTSALSSAQAYLMSRQKLWRQTLNPLAYTAPGLGYWTSIKRNDQKSEKTKHHIDFQHLISFGGRGQINAKLFCTHELWAFTSHAAATWSTY